MIRWSYLIPRVLILILIVLAIWMGADPLIRLALIKSGENSIGAKVEIAQVRSSLTTGMVYLKDLRIADPRNPMMNLVQAEMAYIKLDPRHLLKHELVIESGKTSLLQFGTPRTDSGALERTPVNAPVIDTLVPIDARQQLSEISQRWLDQFQNSMAQRIESSFESVRLAQELKSRWPSQFEANKQEIIAVQNKINELTEIVQSKDSSNPLRAGRVVAALTEVQSLREQITLLRHNLARLQRQAIKDHDALLASKAHDEKKIREIVRNAEFDSETVSQLLLTDMQSRNINELVQWFRWFRSSIPNPDQDFYPIRNRGTDILFADVQPQPRFLIKSLEIDGEGRLAGKHFNFAGTATNLTTQPELCDQPAGFHLRAQGQQHFIVDCTIDRRTASKVDSINVQCPDLTIDPQILGNQNSISVSMGPSRLQAEIALKLVDDQLEGELVFRHSDVLMHVDQVHELAGGQDTALRLNQDLAVIDRFQTYVQVSGTLDKPEFQLRSDLGTKFAAAMNHVVSERLQQQVASYQARLDQVLNAELSELDQTIQSNLDELSQLLNGEANIISKLQEAAPSLSERPKIR
jgi:uncharacterized protein (TIGR03545 family)